MIMRTMNKGWSRIHQSQVEAPVEVDVKHIKNSTNPSIVKASRNLARDLEDRLRQTLDIASRDTCNRDTTISGGID